MEGPPAEALCGCLPACSRGRILLYVLCKCACKWGCRFHKRNDLQKVWRKKKEVIIPKLMFGSLIVNEEIYPHREDCIKHLECGILFPVDEIPEDYLN